MKPERSVPLAAALETHRRLPSSHLHVVTLTGHAVNLERPEAMNSGIHMFVEEVNAREGEG